MDGSNFKEMRVLKIEEIPLYKDVKVIDGALIYGEVIGAYTMFYLEDSNYNGPFIAVTINDDSMDPGIDGNRRIAIKSQILTEMDTPLTIGKLGLFSFNGECIIRKFKVGGKNPVLEAFNKNYPEIRVEDKDEFYILGRVVESSNVDDFL
ncbi:MAG: S24 family peptidase [Psychrilyobacter sp.]|uniref:S24 family peptidase n=1 Tax=Psychrilyobacter sp. TaxID=2586924 RepID=UPI003C70C58A